MGHTVGFIGLGLMGGAIAQQYIAAGHKPIVFDLSETLVEHFVAQGAEGATSPRDVADRASVVVACLPSPSASRKVAFEEDGVCFGRAVRIYIETSTIGVKACQDIERRMAEKNIRMVDAPVSGGPRAAAKGALTSMVSTAPGTWLEVADIIKAYSGKAYVVGDKPGLAQACKLVNNAMSLTTLALACETAVFGVASGLDARTMIDVINVSSGRSAATTDKFPESVLTRSFDYGASMRTAAKDLELFVQEAQALGMDVSGTSFVADIWKRAARTGDPERDFTALIQQFEAPLGVLVGAPREDAS